MKYLNVNQDMAHKLKQDRSTDKKKDKKRKEKKIMGSSKNHIP